MKQRTILSLSFTILCIAIGWQAALAKDEKPNIVMILSDDQTWTDYGFMGHDVIRTPHLDKLASESVLYPRAYVPTPLCRPSLMTLATGHYAKDHLITGNDPSTLLADWGSPEHISLSKQMLSNIDRLETLPKLLAREGYLSHQSGKWWEGNHKRGGFTHGMTEGKPGTGVRHGDAGLTIGREGLAPIEEFIDMAQGDGMPFYIWYAPFLPHTPHNPPERLLEYYSDMDLDPALAKYYAMCEWFDETCGDLIGLLEERGIRENTLIYYVCDNGWIQRTADMALPEGWFTSFAPGSKQSVREGGVRSPVMLSWPGTLEPDIKGDLVNSIDLMPTALSAAGVDAPAGLPGIDLLPNARDGERIARDTIFGDCYAHDIADLENPEASLMYLWCIQDQWKLILSYDGEVNRYEVMHPRGHPVQLYNVVDDPFEKRNLAELYPQIASRLKDEIENWYPLAERRLMIGK